MSRILSRIQSWLSRPAIPPCIAGHREHNWQFGAYMNGQLIYSCSACDAIAHECPTCKWSLEEAPMVGGVCHRCGGEGLELEDASDGTQASRFAGTVR